MTKSNTIWLTEITTKNNYKILKAWIEGEPYIGFRNEIAYTANGKDRKKVLYCLKPDEKFKMWLKAQEISRP